MTEALKTDYMPTMDEAMRFIHSNPNVSFAILADRLKLGDEDNAAVSGGRFRELWKHAGGMYGSKTPPKNRDIAWIETELLPSVLHKIIDAYNKVAVTDATFTADLLKAAKAEERERCAKIADQYANGNSGHGWTAAHNIAAAIRSAEGDEG